jgi:hypothetical protein
MDGTTRNQDAVNVGGPAEDVLIKNLRGTPSDGAVTISTRGTAASWSVWAATTDPVIGSVVIHSTIDRITACGRRGKQLQPTL